MKSPLALAVLLVLAATTAEAHCFKVWRYPWSQHCNANVRVSHQVLAHRWRHHHHDILLASRRDPPLISRTPLPKEIPVSLPHKLIDPPAAPPPAPTPVKTDRDIAIEELRLKLLAVHQTNP